MKRYDLLDRFQLNDKLLCNNKIHHISAINLDSFVYHW